MINKTVIDLITELNALPELIRDKSKHILLKTKERIESEYLIETIRLKTINAVTNEMDGDKAKYSNDIKRKWETDQRLSLNESYKQLEEKVKTLKQELQEEEIALRFLRDKLGSVRAIAGVIDNF